MVREDKPSGAPLFATLLASRPKRRTRASIAGLIASVVGHVVALGWALWLTREARPSSFASGEDVFALIVQDESFTPLPTATAARGGKPVVRPRPRPTPVRRSTPVPPKLQIPDAPIAHAAQIAPVPPVDLKILGEELNRLTEKIGETLKSEARSEKSPSPGGAQNGAAPNGVASNGDGNDGDVGAEPTIEELKAGGPRFTPYSMGPLLLNRAEIAALLRQRYPEDLRVRGVGGLTTLWLLIDKDGKARKAVVHNTSGREAFDALAIEAVPFMRFQPAVNNGKSTNVWVQLPVRFRVVEGY